jgi:hypothetical protein
MSTFKKLALILLLFATVSAVSATVYPSWTEPNNVSVWTMANISAGTNYIYVTKGTGDTGSGDDVFLFFNDFLGTSVDGNFTVTGTVEVADSVATLTDDDAIRSIRTFGQGTALTLYTKADEQDTIFASYYQDTSNHLEIANSDVDYTDYDRLRADKIVSGSQDDNYVDGLLDFRTDYYNYEIQRKTTQTIFLQNGTVFYTNTGTLTVNTTVGASVYDSSQESSLYVDYIFVRNIADTEPIVTNIEVLDSNTLKYTITSSDTLENYQVKLDATQLSLSSQSELLQVSDTYSSDSEISINVTDISNRTITMIYNSTGVDHSTINWGDGTTSSTTEENTILYHTYDYDKNFSISAYGYDELENYLGSESTTAYILLDMQYVEDYYTILVANPYNEDLIDYPLNMTFDSENFDWWNTNITPLGTNIYFRTNDTIYEHYIAEWSAGSTTGNIYVNISEIPANDYLTFYMCFASYDYPQFEVNTETEYTLLWTITDFQQQEEDNNDTFERVSTDVEEYQNITVVFVDEQTFISGCLKSGTISFSDENGGRVVYTFEQPVLGILEVSAASENGTILVATSDGITRELTYSSSSALNIVTLPNSYTVPITISAPGDVEVYTNGYLVTTAVAPADIYLALNAKYDIYLNSEALRTDYVVTKEDILYETITAVKTVDTTVVDYHLDGETITATISATSTATLEIEGTTNYSIENVTTITGIEKDSHYKLYNASGAVIEEGIFYGIDVGYLGLLNSQFSEKTSAIIALFVIGVTLLTGTYVSLHYTMTLAAMEVALFSYIYLIPFDPLTKSILTLIAFAVALLMWVKR